MADRSEMARNATEKIKFCIDLKWPELVLKVNFRHPKWPIDTQMADRSEMARNAIESDFRTSKMADGSHFVKFFKNN